MTKKDQVLDFINDMRNNAYHEDEHDYDNPKIEAFIHIGDEIHLEMSYSGHYMDELTNRYVPMMLFTLFAVGDSEDVRMVSRKQNTRGINFSKESLTAWRNNHELVKAYKDRRFNAEVIVHSTSYDQVSIQYKWLDKRKVFIKSYEFENNKGKLMPILNHQLEELIEYLDMVVSVDCSLKELPQKV